MEYQRQKNFQEENREVKKKSIYTMTPKVSLLRFFIKLIFSSKTYSLVSKDF